jgi:hypothetical protein
MFIFYNNICTCPNFSVLVKMDPTYTTTREVAIYYYYVEWPIFIFEFIILT